MLHPSDDALVFIVDPHSIFRLGVATCLESLPLIGAVVGVSTVTEAAKHPELPRADLVIADAAAPGLRDLVHELRTQTDAPTLVSGSGWQAEEISAILEAGAAGVLSKESLTPATLEANVRAALLGAGVLPSDLMARVLGGAGAGLDAPDALVHSQLNTREQQVLSLIAEGHATREVAAQLSYSERTIKNVLHDVATKLGARSRSHAVAHAVREGLI